MNGHETKSVRTAYLFWLVGLFGCLGVHRMYLGKRRTARLWLFTAGVLGIGALADAFLLQWLVRRHNLLADLCALRRRLKSTQERKQEAVDQQRYEEAASLRDQEVSLLSRIAKLQSRLT